MLDRDRTSAATVQPDREVAFNPVTESRSRLRILIIGINYAPELTGIAPYTTAVAAHYAGRGHTVRVVTGAPHYPEWRRVAVPTCQPGSNPTVARYWHFVPGRADAIQRLLYEGTWLISASRGVLAARCDVVIGIIPNLSDGVLALMAGRRWGAPVGLVVKDLLGPAAAQSGYRGGGAVASLTAKVEQYVARRADRIAVISHGFQRYLEKAGVPTTRIQRVCDWTHDGAPTESVLECRKRLGWGEHEFVCLHAGNMGQKQGLDSVLDAAVLLKGQGIKIVLSGDGNDRTRLQDRARHLRLANLSFLELQPSGQYEAMLLAADVLLLNQRASVGDMSLPSKLASYFASGRPIVAAVATDSEAAGVLELAGAGRVVTPGDPRALADALNRLHSSPRTRDELGRRGKDYAARHLSEASALDAYRTFLGSLARSTRGNERPHYHN